MKKFTITLVLIAFATFACKKKTQYCYWTAEDNSRILYIWENSKPTDAQVKAVQDTCSCTLILKDTCMPCKQMTDGSGNDFGCD